MAIKRIGKTWYIDIQTPGVKGPEGRIRESLKTTDKRRAQQLHDKLAHEMWDREHLDKGPSKTWSEALTQYEQDYTGRTWDTVKYRFKRLALYIDKDTQLTSIRANMIKKVRDGERAKGKKPATIDRVLSQLSAVLTMAADYEWIGDKPVIRMSGVKNRRNKVLTQDEESRLLNELPDYLKPVFRFALLTGMRQGNVLSMRFDQVNFEKETVTFSAEEMKNDRAWTRALGKPEMAIIRNQRGNKSPFVFTRKGNQITRLDNKSWKTWCRRAGVENFTWHGLRHTWATRYMQAGGTTAMLIILGAWSNIQVPLDRYAHLDIRDQRQAIEQTSQKAAKSVS